MNFSLYCYPTYYAKYGNGREIVVYGTGDRASTVVDCIRFFGYNVSFFVSKSWSETPNFMERSVFGNDRLDKSKHYVIVGSQLYNDEIVEELLRLGFIPEQDFVEHDTNPINMLMFSYLQEKLMMGCADKLEVFPDHTEITLGTCDSKSIKMHFDDMSFDVPNIVLSAGSYEKKEEEEMMHRILSRLPENANIFDIGSNVGYFSLCYKAWFPKSNVYAFEPLLPTYNMLIKNIDLNQMSDINVHNLGFYDSEQVMEFYYNNEVSGLSGLKNHHDSNAVTKFECKVTTLDSFINLSNLRIDFIKIDVEGAELFVFKGGSEVLKKFKPVIFTELFNPWTRNFGYSPNDMIEYMAGLGYLCYCTDDDLPKLNRVTNITSETKQANFIFMHSSSLESYNDLF